MRATGLDSGKIEVSAAIPNRVMCGPEPLQTVQPGSSKRSEANCNATRFRATRAGFELRRGAPTGDTRNSTRPGGLCSLAQVRAMRARGNSRKPRDAWSVPLNTGRPHARFWAEKQSLGDRQGDAPPRAIAQLSKPIAAWPYCRRTLAIRCSEFSALLNVRAIDGLAAFTHSRALPAPMCAAPERRSRVRFAPDLYNREDEFGAVGVQGFVDHRMSVAE